MASSYEASRKKQEEYYNKTADQYDSWHTEPKSAQIVDEWNFDNLKKSISAVHITTVLDLACGTGRLLKNLRTISSDVHGVDQSIKLLEIAKSKYPDVNFSVGEVSKLPYESSKFDLVVINGSLHHFFAIEKSLAEVYRVLKPGGKLAILGEPNKRYHHLYNPFFYVWIFSRIIARTYQLFVKPKFDSREIEPEAEDFTISQLKNCLQSVGFTINTIYSYDYFPRAENRVFLKMYWPLLQLERRSWSRWLPGLGSAIQCFAEKPRA